MAPITKPANKSNSTSNTATSNAANTTANNAGGRSSGSASKKQSIIDTSNSSSTQPIRSLHSVLMRGQDGKKNEQQQKELQQADSDKPTAMLNVLSAELTQEEFIEKAIENLKVIEDNPGSFKSLGKALRSQLAESVQLIKRLNHNDQQPAEHLKEIAPEEIDNVWKQKLEECQNKIEWYRNQNDECNLKIQNCEKQRQKEIEQNEALRKEIAKIKNQLTDLEKRCARENSDDETIRQLREENERNRSEMEAMKKQLSELKISAELSRGREVELEKQINEAKKKEAEAIRVNNTLKSQVNRVATEQYNQQASAFRAARSQAQEQARRINQNDPAYLAKIKERQQRNTDEVIILEKGATAIRSHQEIYNSVQQTLAPLKKDVKFKDVRLNKAGKVIVILEKGQDKAKVRKQLDKINDAEQRELRHRRRLLVKRVPSHLSMESIKADMLTYQGLEEHQYNARFKYNGRYRDLIITTDDDLALRLLNDRFVLGYRPCQVTPDIEPDQCYHCAAFGHRALLRGQLVCQNDPVCLRCGGDHNARECDSANKERTLHGCKNCKATNHPPSSKRCPVYLKKQRLLDERW